MAGGYISDEEEFQYEFATVSSSRGESSPEHEKSGSGESFTYVSSQSQSQNDTRPATRSASQSPSTSPKQASNPNLPTSSGEYYSIHAPPGFKPVDKYPMKKPPTLAAHSSSSTSPPKPTPSSTSESLASNFRSRFTSGLTSIAHSRSTSSAMSGTSTVHMAKDEAGWYDKVPSTPTPQASRPSKEDQEKLQKISEENIKLNAHVDRLLGRVGELEEAEKALKSSEEKLQTANKSLEDTVKELEQQFKEEAGRSEEAVTEIVRLEEEVEKSRSALDSEIARLENEVEKARQEHEVTKSELQQLLGTRGEDSAEIKASYESLKESSTKEIDRLLIEVGKLTSDLIDMEKLRSELASATKDLEEVREERKMMMEEKLKMEVLTKSLEEAREALTKSQKELKDLVDKDFEDKFEKLNEAHQSLQKAYDDLSKIRRDLVSQARITRVQTDVLRAQLPETPITPASELAAQLVDVRRLLMEALEQNKVLDDKLEEKRKQEEVLRYSRENLLRLGTTSPKTAVEPVDVESLGLSKDQTPYALAEKNQKLEIKLSQVNRLLDDQRTTAAEAVNCTADLEKFVDEVLNAFKKVEEKNLELFARLKEAGALRPEEEEEEVVPNIDEAPSSTANICQPSAVQVVVQVDSSALTSSALFPPQIDTPPQYEPKNPHSPASQPQSRPSSAASFNSAQPYGVDANPATTSSHPETSNAPSHTHTPVQPLSPPTSVKGSSETPTPASPNKGNVSGGWISKVFGT